MDLMEILLNAAIMLLVPCALGALLWRYFDRRLIRFDKEIALINKKIDRQSDRLSDAEFNAETEVTPFNLVFIVAGNLQEAKTWRRANKYTDSQCIYVTHKSAFGIELTQSPQVYFVGTWQKRADALELREAAQSAGAYITDCD